MIVGALAGLPFGSVERQGARMKAAKPTPTFDATGLAAWFEADSGLQTSNGGVDFWEDKWNPGTGFVPDPSYNRPGVTSYSGSLAPYFTYGGNQQMRADQLAPLVGGTFILLYTAYVARFDVGQSAFSGYGDADGSEYRTGFDRLYAFTQRYSPAQQNTTVAYINDGTPRAMAMASIWNGDGIFVGYGGDLRASAGEAGGQSLNRFNMGLDRYGYGFCGAITSMILFAPGWSDWGSAWNYLRGKWGG